MHPVPQHLERAQGRVRTDTGGEFQRGVGKTAIVRSVKGFMAKLARIPTRQGDVLILLTTLFAPTYSVATVAVDGQQDFGGGENVMHLPDMAAAVKAAKMLMTHGSCTYLINIDTGDWALVPSQDSTK
jgi:hypothetical protein